MKINIKIPNALSVLFILSFLSSRLLFWTRGTWNGYYGFYSMSPAVGTLDQMLLAISAILGVAVSLYGFIREIRRHGFLIVLLSSGVLLMCFIVWVIKFLDKNPLTLLFVGNFTPLFLLFMGCVFLGFDESFVLFLSKLCKILANICLLLALYFTAEFYFTYTGTGIRFGNSLIMAFFQYGFYFATFYVFTNKDLQYDSKKHHMIVLSLLALVIAVCSVSRGWILQAVILVLYVMLGNENGKSPNYSKLVRRIVVVLLVLVIVAALLIEYVPKIMGTLGNRLMQDTRSTQLDEFLSQLTPANAFFGQGYDATYIESAHGTYSYIDNQFLMMIFRYGILPAFVYCSMFVYATIMSFRKRKAGNIYWLAVLMWMLALNGLAIYLSLNIDIQNFVTLLLCGRAIASAKKETTFIADIA